MFNFSSVLRIGVVAAAIVAGASIPASADSFTVPTGGPDLYDLASVPISAPNNDVVPHLGPSGLSFYADPDWVDTKLIVDDTRNKTSARSVPEPSSLFLLATGLLGVAVLVRSRFSI